MCSSISRLQQGNPFLLIDKPYATLLKQFWEGVHHVVDAPESAPSLRCSPVNPIHLCQELNGMQMHVLLVKQLS